MRVHVAFEALDRRRRPQLLLELGIGRHRVRGERGLELGEAPLVACGTAAVVVELRPAQALGGLAAERRVAGRERDRAGRSSPARRGGIVEVVGAEPHDVAARA